MDFRFRFNGYGIEGLMGFMELMGKFWEELIEGFMGWVCQYIDYLALFLGDKFLIMLS